MTNADDIIEYGRSSGRDDELDPEGEGEEQRAMGRNTPADLQS